MCVADMRFNPTPKFLYDCLAPEIGDTIAMDLRLMIPMPDITLKRALLNGQPLTHVKNKAPFQVRYDQPGTYPLHFRVERNDWEQDSLYVYEKTYYLKVR